MYLHVVFTNEAFEYAQTMLKALILYHLWLNEAFLKSALPRATFFKVTEAPFSHF